MFNRKIEITEENIEILFINAVIENLRYGIISLDTMFRGYRPGEFCDDVHTFYFYHMQSLLTAQGNIWNVLFNDFYQKREVSRRRVQKLREIFDIDIKHYPLIGNKKFRNTNEHFDERYYQFGTGLGDFNILDSRTPDEVRHQILTTPHLRTIDIEKWLYITYDRKGKQITLDLKELREEMYALLKKLCDHNIRKQTVY